MAQGSDYMIVSGVVLWLIAFADLSIFHYDIFNILLGTGMFIIAMGIGMRIRGF